LFTLISFEVIRVNNYLQTILNERKREIEMEEVCVCVCVCERERERERMVQRKPIKFRVTYPIIIINKGEINFVWSSLNLGERNKLWKYVFHIGKSV
jgi:hypothetical protein